MVGSNLTPKNVKAFVQTNKGKRKKNKIEWLGHRARYSVYFEIFRP